MDDQQHLDGQPKVPLKGTPDKYKKKITGDLDCLPKALPLLLQEKIVTNKRLQ